MTVLRLLRSQHLTAALVFMPTAAVAGDLVGGVAPELEPEPPRTSVPPGETRRLRIR